MNNDTLYGEYLALVIWYNEFLGQTILKKEYFEGKYKTMFDIIKTEYGKNKTLIYANLCENKNFDPNFYIELQDSNIHKSSKNIAFKRLEEKIIEQYKNRILFKITKEYDGNQEEFFKNIDDIKKINTLENEMITMEKANRIFSTKKEKIRLGFSSLDKNLRIFKNDFVVIAGGTGTGKTTFALNLLSNMSKEYKCIYFNMEMSEENLYERLFSIETGIDVMRLGDIKNLQPTELKILLSKMDEIEKRNITLINTSQSIEHIESVIAQIDTDKKIIVFLDHIGLINGKGNSQYEKMTEIAKKIRSICLDYDCMIFGICQLSRESQKEEKQPKLQNLRDSGEIEQSARKVLLLYNKDAKTENEIKNIDLIIAKNDAGNYGIKQFKFNTKKQKFMEVENGK